MNSSLSESTGLIGLSICSHSLSISDIDSIHKLLDFGSLFDSKYSGLKYIDLTDNKLSDSNCADLLRSAVHGHIEGIELAKNLIGKGVVFIEVSLNCFYLLCGVDIFFVLKGGS